MSASVNKVTLVGNVGRDPEIRNISDSSKAANFSLATSDVWRDKTTGERKEKTEWHRIVVYDEKIAEVCEKYVRKGAKLFIEGQLQTRKWTDKEGQERISTEIIVPRYKGILIMLDKRETGAGDVHDEIVNDDDHIPYDM